MSFHHHAVSVLETGLFSPESEGLFNPMSPPQPQQQQQQYPTSATDRREKYLNVKSLSTESGMSSSSSRGSDTQPGLKIIGGSYSAATGSSSKIIDSLKLVNNGQPKLAQVASALLKAKAAGQLPSALKSVSRENEAFANKNTENAAAAAAAASEAAAGGGGGGNANPEGPARPPRGNNSQNKQQQQQQQR